MIKTTCVRLCQIVLELLVTLDAPGTPGITLMFIITAAIMSYDYLTTSRMKIKKAIFSDTKHKTSGIQDS